MLELEDKIARAEVIDVSQAVGQGRQVRRHGHARRRGDRGGGRLPDRRRGRGRHRAAPPVGDLAAGARADRQGDRRQRRGLDAARRPLLRGREGRVSLSRRGRDSASLLTKSKRRRNAAGLSTVRIAFSHSRPPAKNGRVKPLTVRLRPGRHRKSEATRRVLGDGRDLGIAKRIQRLGPFSERRLALASFCRETHVFRCQGLRSSMLTR